MTEQTDRKRPEKYWMYIVIGILSGIALGYLYFYFVGCRSGACQLRANPFYNMLLGGLLGYIISDWISMAAFKRKNKDKPSS